jgi:hypothetical protein
VGGCVVKMLDRSHRLGWFMMLDMVESARKP